VNACNLLMMINSFNKFKTSFEDIIEAEKNTPYKKILVSVTGLSILGFGWFCVFIHTRY
jgi:hypothetical protein